MSRPIPKKLLIHSATLVPVSSKDSWGAITYSDDIALKYVRIEPSEKRKLTKENTETQLNSLMFFDCVNSKPSGTLFSKGDKLTFAGTDYVVASIASIYDESRLHHYEVGLV